MAKKKIFLGLAFAAAALLTACDNNTTPNLKKDRGVLDTTPSNIVIPAELTQDECYYTVIHQLQNKDGEYVTVEVETVSAAAGERTNAKPKTYNGYSEKPISNTEVKADCSTTVTIKYDAVKYSVNLNKKAVGGTVTGGGTFDINNNMATLVATPNIGYEFVGWYNKGELFATNPTLTFEANADLLDVTGVFKVKDEFRYYDFSSTESECIINKLADYSVTELVIPEGVTSIAAHAFYGSGLYRVELPSTLKSIGEEAFYNSFRLLSITLKSVPQLGYDAFNYWIEELINLSGTSSLNTFGYNYSIAKEIFNKNDTMITKDEDGYLFAVIDDYNYLIGYVGSDKKLTLPTYPNGDNTIESYSIYQNAFYESDIESIVIPETVYSIESSAFENCDRLVEVYNLSPNINISAGSDNSSYGYLGQHAITVHNDKSKASIVYSNDDYDYVIDSDADGAYATIINYKKKDKENIVIDQINNLPTVIGNSLFKNNNEIKSLTLCGGVVSIQDYAFYNCPNLTNVSLGDCKYIGVRAFDEDYSIYSIELPAALEYIDNYAFAGCRIFEIINKTNLELEIGSYNNGEIAYNAYSIVTDKANSILSESIDGFIYATDDGDKIIVRYVGDNKEVNITSDYAYVNDLAFINSDIEKIAIAPTVGTNKHMFYKLEKLNYLAMPISYPDSYNYFYNYFLDNSYSVPRIKTLIINNEIENIPNGYFDYFSSITTLGLPNTLTSVESWVFSSMDNLSTIYFDGTIDEFYEINFNTNYKITSNGDLSIYEANENGDVTFNGKKYSLFEEYQIPAGTTDLTGIKIPLVVKRVIIPEGVEAIPDECFQNCTNLKEVVIPSTVKTIGNYAFYGCKQLNRVVLPDGLLSLGQHAFYNTALSSIEVPESCTEIGEFAFAYSKIMIAIINSNINTVANYTFADCKNLQAVTYKENLVSIGDGAFENTVLLAKVKITEDLESLGASAFDGSGIISADLSNTKITSIGNYTFYQCKRIQTVKLPDTVETIGHHAFSYSAIQTLDLSNTAVTTIDNYTFSGCTKLTSIKLPEGLTAINDGAFDGCENLGKDTRYENGIYTGDEANPYKFLIGITSTNITSFKLHPDCEAQAAKLFRNCKNLVKVEIPSTMTTIGQLLVGNTSVEELIIPFAGEKGGSAGRLKWLFGNDDNAMKKVPIKKVTLTNTTIVGNNAFQNLAVEEVVLPENLESIAANAFDGCTKLSKINLPTSIKSISNYAFARCPFKTIDLSSLTGLELGTYIFSNCSILEEVVLPSHIKELPDGIFYNCTKITNFDLTDYTSIGVQSFMGTSITEMTVPSTVTKVANRAFYSCFSLTTITFEGQNTTIDYSAFANCSKLETVVLPSKLTKINTGLFQNCKMLQNITIPTTVTEICESAFYQAGIKAFDSGNVTTIGQNAFDSSKVETVTLGKKLTTIGIKVFQNCTSLTEVTINSEKVGNYAFYNCKNLVKATFSDDNTTINQYAFCGCNKLSEISLSKNLSQIGYCGFSGCSSLSTFVLYTYHNYGYDYFPAIYEYAFQNCGLTRVYYTGTAAQFDEAVNGSTSHSKTFRKDGNNVFLNAVVCYSETEPTDSNYTYWHYDDDGNKVIWSKPTE